LSYVCRRPLIYLFSLEHESTASVKLAMDCLQRVAVSFFGKRLQPGVCVTDMSDGLRTGMKYIHVDRDRCVEAVEREDEVQITEEEYNDIGNEVRSEDSNYHRGANRCPTGESEDQDMDSEVERCEEAWGRQGVGDSEAEWSTYGETEGRTYGEAEGRTFSEAEGCEDESVDDDDEADDELYGPHYSDWAHIAGT
jgi:hypothetical protein